MSTVELTPEQVQAVTLQELKSDLRYLKETDDPSLYRAMNVVIAYYSVPGTWKEGSYDG